MRLLSLALLGCAPVQPEPLVVLAPGHSRAALQRVAWEWSELDGAPVQVVYAGTERLSHLVDTGATSDVVLAPAATINHLDDARHLFPDSRRVVMGDQLVVVRTLDTHAGRLQGPSDLVEGGNGSIAVAPEVSALGAATERQLTHAGVWLKLQEQRVVVSDGAAVVTAVQNGQTQWGVVEGSRAVGFPDLHTALVLTEGAGAAALVYEGAVVGHSRAPDRAAAFIDHLCQESTRAAFVRVGWVSSARRQAGKPPPSPPTAPPGDPPPPRSSPRQPQPPAK